MGIFLWCRGYRFKRVEVPVLVARFTFSAIAKSAPHLEIQNRELIGLQEGSLRKIYEAKK